MKKLLTGIIVACFVFSMFSVLVPNAKGTASTEVKPLANVNLTPPQIGNASVTSNVFNTNPITQQQYNGTSVTSHRLIILPNGSLTMVTGPLMAGQPNWHSIDEWGPPAGQMPSYMMGTFVAPSNTFTNLIGNDTVIYEPINVDYGTSSSNFVWFQFCIYFYNNGRTDICMVNAPNGGPKFYYDSDILPYAPGHTYQFSLTTSGSSNVLFSIEDYTSYLYWSKYYSVPGTTLLQNAGGGYCYSPASCVEGYTQSNPVSGVPTFTTSMGSGETDYYYWVDSNIPQGIGSNVWNQGSYFNWAMVGQKYVSSYISSTTYGNGQVTNPSDFSAPPNGVFANIYGANSNAGGNIEGSLVSAGGNLYVDCISASGYSSSLYLYVSSDGSTWHQVGSTLTITKTYGQHVYVGAYNQAFNYVAIASIDSGSPTNLSVDAIAVGP